MRLASLACPRTDVVAAVDDPHGSSVAHVVGLVAAAVVVGSCVEPALVAAVEVHGLVALR